MIVFPQRISALLLFVFHCILISKCESNLSVASLTNLAKSEQQLLKSIRELQQKKSLELEKLQRKIVSIDQEYNKAINDPEDYLSNPINAYKLIKRIFIDWAEIHNFIVDNNTTKLFAKEWKSKTENMELPSESDLQKTIEKLTNQENRIDGAGGDLIYGPRMKWYECYDIGMRLYDKDDFMGAISWLELALDKAKDLHVFNDEIKVDIMEYIAFSQYSLGDPNNALLIMEQLPKLHNLHSRLSEEKAFFKMKAGNFVTKIAFGDPHFI